jgi:hypothetical protein
MTTGATDYLAFMNRKRQLLDEALNAMNWHERVIVRYDEDGKRRLCCQASVNKARAAATKQAIAEGY